MQFRFAQPDEIPSIARLVAHSFVGRSLDFWSEQLRDPPQGGGVKDLLVGESGKELIASLQILPLRQWIAGAALPMAGVGVVTVSPTHRQKGVAAALMTHALRSARERGDVASALYPFRFSFYQKLGYGASGVALQYLVPPDALPASVGRERVERMETPKQQREALELYSSWIREQNGQIERNPRMWERACTASDVGLVGYRNTDGALGGYALVAYRVDLPVNDRYLEVKEMVWTSDQARDGLIGWLASLGDQWRLVMIRALPSHQLGEMIREPVLPRGTAPSWGLWTASATQLFRSGCTLPTDRLPKTAVTGTCDSRMARLTWRAEPVPTSCCAWTYRPFHASTRAHSSPRLLTSLVCWNVIVRKSWKYWMRHWRCRNHGCSTLSDEARQW
jgi:predicted N-acetyltransferase YhbS